MNDLEGAQQAERDGRFEEAATLYERVLVTDALPLESLIDLVAIYWQATDPGMSASEKFSRAFWEAAPDRVQSLLDYAAYHFPGNVQARFWRRYIAWTDLGEPFSRDECRAMLMEHPDYREPAMFLCMTSKGKEALEQVIDLYLEYENKTTMRARYVLSVLSSLVHRHVRK